MPHPFYKYKLSITYKQAAVALSVVFHLPRLVISLQISQTLLSMKLHRDIGVRNSTLRGATQSWHTHCLAACDQGSEANQVTARVIERTDAPTLQRS